MTRRLLGVAVVLLALGRQDVVGESVAVVNVPVVSERYQKTSDLEARFDVVRRELNEQRNALREKIDRAARSLQEEFKPGTDDFEARRKQLAMLEAELQYFIESQGRLIEARLAQSLRVIFDDIHAVVREVAEDKGVDVVLAADRMPDDVPTSSTQVRQHILLQKVLYWSPQVDLTDEVVARLNVRYQAQGGASSLGALTPGTVDDAQARVDKPPQMPGSARP